MAKPTFKRSDGGGYGAKYKIDDTVFEAQFVKAGKQWKIDSGYAAQERQWKKLSDLKRDWVQLCEADAFPLTAAPPTTGVPGPPKLGGPPTIGPPKITPPPVPEIGTSPCSAPDEAVARGEKTHCGIDMGAFETFLKQQGKLCGPCKNGFAQCEVCKMHVSDWEKAEDGVIYPPCRCDPGSVLASEYVADSLDPRMWGRTLDGSMRTITPIGALDQVYNWMRLHPEHCTFNGKLVEPFASVQKVLYAITGYAEFRPEVWR